MKAGQELPTVSAVAYATHKICLGLELLPGLTLIRPKKSKTQHCLFHDNGDHNIQNMVYKYINSAEEDTGQAQIIQPHSHSLILRHKQCLNILSHSCDYYYNYLLHECSEFLVTTMPVGGVCVCAHRGGFYCRQTFVWTLKDILVCFFFFLHSWSGKKNAWIQATSHAAPLNEKAGRCVPVLHSLYSV